MAIKFNVIERVQPGVTGGGKKKWYAVAATNGEMTVDDMVKQIEKFSALSEADIRGVIVAMENVMQAALSDSMIVRMEKIGSFYPTLSSGPANTENEFNQSLIKSVGVNYRPGKRILDAMEAADFEKLKK